MSASPKTAVDAGASVVTLTSASLRAATRASSSGEALQALLAFSALHQQVRQRRVHEDNDVTAPSLTDGWRLEHFVLDEVLQLVAERALRLTGADGVAIALAEGDAITCRAVAGKVTPDAGVRLDPNSGFSGMCLSSGQMIRCDDSETDPRVNAAVCRALGTRSMVAVPLPAKRTNIGLLEAFSTEAHGFNDSDVRSLSLLAELILAALRPEEEDRLAEISRRVVPSTAVSVSAPDQLQKGHSEVVRSETIAEPRNREPVMTAAAVEPTEPTPPPPAIKEHGTATNLHIALAVVTAVLVIAVAVGTGLRWSLHHNASPVASVPQNAPAGTSSASQAQTQTTTAAPIAESAEPDQDAGEQEPSSTTASGQRPEVTGIRHWSSGDSSTVVIDLQDQVQYEAHRLSHPERIYVDLPDTRLVASLFNKTIDVGDALLQRVRVAQPTPGVTRVVIETKGTSNFSVSLEPNPYRLVIAIRTIGSNPTPRAKVELFGPMDQQQSPFLAENSNKGASRSAIHPGEPKLRIVLDAGHGGWDLGTVGRKGLLEKDLVLDIVERLGLLVQKRLAASVIYTRTDDNYVALEKRAEVANLAKATLFLSIHANYSDFPSARGVETYYTNTYSSVRARTRESDDAETVNSGVDWTNVDIREKVHESRRLAVSIQRSLYGTLSTANPGLPNRGVKRAQYVVLTGTSMPAVLAEVSFVSSPTDENNLLSSGYRQRIAEALYQGVARYAEGNRVKMASAEKPAGQ